MPRPSRETIMTALFTTLVNSIKTSFTANTQAGSAVLLNPSTTAGLFIGLPVAGGSIPDGAVIQSLAPLTLSQPAAQNAAGVALITGFKTVGRRMIPWGQVPAQPALFLEHTKDENEWLQTTIQKRVMYAQLWIYSNAGQNPNTVPEIALNNIADAIDTVFLPDRPQLNRFTLGDLVYHCRLAGAFEFFRGDLASQAIAVGDVEIIVP